LQINGYVHKQINLGEYSQKKINLGESTWACIYGQIGD
jgi:hypothetical protein